MINVVVQTLIQPRFTGDAVGVNPTVAFISLIFWSYLLGVLGALLAIPATKFVKSLLVDHSVTGQWFGALINSKPKPEDRHRPRERGRGSRPNARPCPSTFAALAATCGRHRCSRTSARRSWV